MTKRIPLWAPLSLCLFVCIFDVWMAQYREGVVRDLYLFDAGLCLGLGLVCIAAWWVAREPK